MMDAKCSWAGSAILRSPVEMPLGTITASPVVARFAFVHGTYSDGLNSTQSRFTRCRRCSSRVPVPLRRHRASAADMYWFFTSSNDRPNDVAISSTSDSDAVRATCSHVS